MPQALELKEIAAQNPAVDPAKVTEALRIHQAALATGTVTERKYDLVSPFARLVKASRGERTRSEIVRPSR